MPVLTVGKTVRSAKPTLLVENAFKPGAYRFQLVVVDDSGNASAPAMLTVTVKKAVRGTTTGTTGPILTHGPVALPTPAPTPRRPRVPPVAVTPAPTPIPTPGPVEIPITRPAPPIAAPRPIKPTRPQG